MKVENVESATPSPVELDPPIESRALYVPKSESQVAPSPASVAPMPDTPAVPVPPSPTPRPLVNPYNQVAREPAGNEYDAIIQSFVAGDVRKSMAVSVDKQPDVEARIQNLARAYDLPIDAVRLNRPDVETRYKLDQFNYDELAQMFPTTSNLLSNPNAAAIAHDDVDNMTGIEKALRPAIGSIRAMGRLVADIPAAVYGVGEGIAKTAAPLFDPLAGTIFPENPLRRIAAGFEDFRKKSQAIGNLIQGPMPADAGVFERNLYNASRSFGDMLPGLAMTLATRNPGYALYSGGVIQGGDSITDALDKGAAPIKALTLGAADATAEVFFEKFGVSRLLKDVAAGSGFGKMLFGQIIREVPGEMATTLVQNFNEWALIHPDKPFADFVAELGPAERDTVISTIMQTTMTAGLGAGIVRFANRQSNKAEQAQRAVEAATRLEALTKLSEASKLRERSPSDFEQFIADASENGPLKDVYISAAALAQSGVAEQIVQASPSVAEQFATALQTGGDVRIPLAEYASRIAGAGYGQQILKDLKTDPDAITLAEAQALRAGPGDQVVNEISSFLESHGDKLTTENEGKAIGDYFTEALNAAGRFSPAVNRAYAQLPRAFFETMAQRLGGTPVQLFEEYKPAIVAQGVTGPMLSQDERGGFVPRELTEDGRPIIGLFKHADLSTFLHESGHYFLESYADMAAKAPALQEDLNTLLSWFGVEDAATWQAMTLDEKREYHEKFARGFEAYLFEGKSPSLKMQSLFARFRDWLARVYNHIRHLNVDLTPEVRAVMDRMLATDAHITEANQARALAPLFTTAEQAAAHGVNWNEYRSLGAQATEDAISNLEARSMRDMAWTSRLHEKTVNRIKREAKALRDEIRAQVEAQVMTEPVYAAQRWIKEGILPDGTPTTGAYIDTAALKDMYGDGPATPRRYLATNLVSAEGMHPDVMAEMFGFPSGDAMIRQIVAAEPINDKIDALTDQAMLERHGDLTSAEALARAADQAIHSDVRARFLATELAGLQKAVGGAQAIARMAKDYAAKLVERTPAGKIQPAMYAAAEVRAGKAAEAAMRKGDTNEAIKQKRYQIINHAATRAAYDALDEVRKTSDLFDKAATGNAKELAKTRNMDIVNAARAILSDYGVGMRGKRPREYMDAVKSYDPELYAVLEPMLIEAEQNARPWEELTVAELRALRDTIDSLWYLSRRERQVEIDGELVDREQITTELIGRLESLGIPDKVPGEGQAVTENEKKVRYIMGVRAALRRVESWVDRMDGGDITGAFRRYVFTPISEAADRYRTDAGAYMKRYRDMLQAIEPTLTPGRIDAPEIGYTFGFSQGDAGKAELLHAMLHTGNESNERKLLLGRGWATETEEGIIDRTRWDAFVARMIREGKLTKADFDFMQAVWDLLEEIKPLAQKTHRQVFGSYFSEITARPFANEFGTYRGGYVPAIADTFEVQDAAIHAELDALNQGNSYMFPATARGFTKSRVEYNRPLALDLRLLPQHIDKALLFAHMEPKVRDVMRTLRAKGFAGKLNRYDQVAYSDMLLPWLNRAAKQTVETPTTGWGGKMADRFFRAARSRAGMAAMFANFTNALQQLTGFSIAAVKVKPSILAAATWRYMRDPSGVAEQVAELSPVMASRQTNEVMQMRQEIEDLLINPGNYETAKRWTAKHAYFLQSAFQNVVDTITWAGAYDQAIAEGHSETDAVRSANAVVRATQGSLQPEDISRFEAGPAFVRLFTQFTGYFNMQANLMGTEFAKVAQEMGIKAGAGKLFYIALLGFLAPAWVSEAIIQAMRGGPEPDKDGEYLGAFLSFFFGAPLRNMAPMVPVAGQVVTLGVNTFNNKPYDDRMSTAPAVAMLESAVRAPHSVYKAIADNGKSSRAIRDTLTLVTVATGMPVAALGKPLGYLADVMEDRINPTGPIDAARGLISGVASEASKR